MLISGERTVAVFTSDRETLSREMSGERERDKGERSRRNRVPLIVKMEGGKRERRKKE